MEPIHVWIDGSFSGSSRIQSKRMGEESDSLNCTLRLAAPHDKKNCWEEDGTPVREEDGTLGQLADKECHGRRIEDQLNHPMKEGCDHGSQRAQDAMQRDATAEGAIVAVPLWWFHHGKSPTRPWCVLHNMLI
jgi:hypothetical protein